MAVDPLWSSRVWLLQCNGTPFEEVAAANWSVLGSAAYVTGALSGTQALSNPASNGFFEGPSTAPFAGDFSIEFIFRANATAGNQTIAGDEDPSGTNGGWTVFLNSSGNLTFRGPLPNGGAATTTSGAYGSNAWWFVQCIRSGNTFSIRTAAIGAGPTASVATVTNTSPTLNVGLPPRIGADTNNGTGFTGDVMMVRASKIAVTDFTVPTVLWPVGGGTNSVLNATPAAYVIARPSVRMSLGRRLNVTPAAYAVAAPSVRLSIARNLSVTPAAYAIAAPAVALGLGLGLSVSPTAYAIVAPDVRLTLTNSGIAYTLNVAPSAYAVAAAQVGMSIGYGLGVLPANYTVVPADVGFGRGLSLGVAPAAYAIAPAAALMSIGYGLGVLPAAYVVESPAASLARGFALGVQPAAYDIGQVNVSMGLSRVLSVTPAAYDIEALPVGLTLGRPYPPTQWVYWTEPAENRTYTVPAENRQFDIPGENRYFKVVKP